VDKATELRPASIGRQQQTERQTDGETRRDGRVNFVASVGQSFKSVIPSAAAAAVAVAVAATAAGHQLSSDGRLLLLTASRPH